LRPIRFTSNSRTAHNCGRRRSRSIETGRAGAGHRAARHAGLASSTDRRVEPEVPGRMRAATGISWESGDHTLVATDHIRVGGMKVPTSRRDVEVLAPEFVPLGSGTTFQTGNPSEDASLVRRRSGGQFSRPGSPGCHAGLAASSANCRHQASATIARLPRDTVIPPAAVSTAIAQCAVPSATA